MIVDGDYVYISNQFYGTSSFAFGDQAIFSRNAFDSTKAYSNPGWYQYQTVPEPTSGLLLLLGMAGLAPKRKQVAHWLAENQQHKEDRPHPRPVFFVC